VFSDQLLSLLKDNILNIISLSFSLIAVYSAFTISRHDQVNANSWETYRSYNSEEVRRGRAVTTRILKTTNKKGFATRQDYEEYFGSYPELGTEQYKDRQAYHDLASFYHHTGLLLARKRLDRDFTLSLVGSGLKDRWPLYEAIETFYGESENLTYGGIYILYDAYLSWVSSRPAKLRKRMNETIKQFRAKRPDLLAKTQKR
jgi:hypothetical protein